jgi:2-C-methyl-D-erythritol 4-phosphate cytidylyltransferase
MNEPRYFAIIPAAGSGSRMQTKLPKQYLSMQGKPILSHTLERLIHTGLFHHIMLVISPHDTRAAMIVHPYPHVTLVEGGERRMDSVRQGLCALEGIADPQDWIFVHDAARPLIATQEILALAEALKQDPVGGILGVPVRDTLKKCDKHGNIVTTWDRNDVWAAQTPQAFRFHVLQQALSDPSATFTDEASAVEQLGLPVKMIKGCFNNFKITYPEDLSLAESILKGEQ